MVQTAERAPRLRVSKAFSAGVLHAWVCVHLKRLFPDRSPAESRFRQKDCTLQRDSSLLPRLLSKNPRELAQPLLITNLKNPEPMTLDHVEGVLIKFVVFQPGVPPNPIEASPFALM